jgi:hypothetical protein
MLTLELASSEATAAQVRRKLGLRPGELDASFGVVEIDPARHLYTVLVDEKAAERVAGLPGVEGPHANPPIEPFGPPESRAPK